MALAVLLNDTVIGISPSRQEQLKVALHLAKPKKEDDNLSNNEKLKVS